MHINLKKRSEISNMILHLTGVKIALVEYAPCCDDCECQGRKDEVLFILNRSLAILKTYELLDNDKLLAVKGILLTENVLRKVNQFIWDFQIQNKDLLMAVKRVFDFVPVF